MSQIIGEHLEAEGQVKKLNLNESSVDAINAACYHRKCDALSRNSKECTKSRHKFKANFSSGSSNPQLTLGWPRLTQCDLRSSSGCLEPRRRSCAKGT
eukprot:829338-Pleurochrysis_carterae.AAC.1